MSWPGIHLQYPLGGPALSHADTLRYLALRRGRLIGMLWADRGSYSIAPLGVDRRDCAESISVTHLLAMIKALELRMPAVDTGATCAA